MARLHGPVPGARAPWFERAAWTRGQAGGAGARAQDTGAADACPAEGGSATERRDGHYEFFSTIW